MRMVQLSVSTSAAATSSYGVSSSCKGVEVVISNLFADGLRDLVVDDDITCLRILEEMLRRCLYIEFVVYLLDKTIASSAKGREIGNERLSGILDLQQVTYKNVDARGLIAGFQFLQAYFPERLAKCYILHMPRFFVSIWRMGSRFIQKATLEKIVVVINEVEKKSFIEEIGGGSRSLSESLESQDITISDPPMPMQLFEFEACPFCRRVREALTELDLSVEVYPCPKGSLRHREMVRSFGGKEQFPFLIDPNSGISMYESGDIVKYLFKHYGKGRNPSMGLLESTLFTGWMPTILRSGRGMTLWDKARQDPPPRKLELFSYENNPYSRIVREALCELELPYILQNVGEGSRRMKLLLDASGSKEVPYILDPNTGTQIGDYKKILSYLFKTYSAATV